MLGIILFALVEVWLKPRQRQHRCLMAILALLFIQSLGELIIYSGAYQYVPSLVGLEHPLRVLLGPALFFYAHATMSADNRLPSRAYGQAAVAPILMILVMLPFVLSLNAEQKLALADPATRNPEHFRLALLTCLTTMAVFVVFTGVYLYAAIKLHSRHRKQLMQRFSALEKRSMDWFKIVLLLWGAAWLLYAIDFVLSWLGGHWLSIGALLIMLEAAVLTVFIHMSLKQPVLSASDKGAANKPQTRTALLKTEHMREIADKLTLAMRRDRLFLHDDLSLNQLSTAICVSENHISETLSQFMHTNFFRYVNEYRVEEAKTLLISSDKPVSSIAYEVGFNSKSTFNSAFKKFAHVTPSAFRSQAKASEPAKVLS